MEDSKVVAIDPPDCGCTECIIGEYVPLVSATHDQLLDLLTGKLGNNAGLVTVTFSRHERGGWGELMSFSIGDDYWHVSELDDDARDRARTLTPDDIDCTS